MSKARRIRRPTEDVALARAMKRGPDPIYEEAQYIRKFIDVDGRAWRISLSHRYVLKDLPTIWGFWSVAGKKLYPTFIMYLRAHRIALYWWETMEV